MTGSLLELCGVVSGYGSGKNRVEVLRGVNLVLNPGECVVLAGKNGCGKSTLFKTILSAVPLYGGKITVCGVDCGSLSDAERAKRIAYIPQTKAVPDVTAGNLALSGRFPYLKYPRRYREDDYREAECALKRAGAYGYRDKRLGELSGGERQKAYIAMALAQGSPVVLMDEPTSNLDVGEQLRFAGTLDSLKSDGKAALVVLHDLLFAMNVADRIAVLADGVVRACMEPEELRQSGVVEAVFGVNIGKADVDGGGVYYYRRAGV